MLHLRYRMELKEIAHFAAPIFAEQLAITLMSTFVAFIMSNISAAAVSGVNIIEGLNYLVQEFFFSIQTGAVVVVARFLGKNDRENAQEAARQSMALTIAAAAITVSGMLLFSHEIVLALLGGAEQAVIDAGYSYFLCATISFPFLALYAICAGIIRGSGHPSRSLSATLLTNILFIVLSLIFVFVFKMDVLGVGLALVLGRAAGAVLSFIMLKKGTDSMVMDKIFPRKFIWDLQKPILRIAVPACIESLFFCGGRLITQTYAVGMGTASMAANAIADSIAGVYCVAGNTTVLTSIPIVSKYLGSGDKQKAKHMADFLTTSITAVMIASSVLLFAFAPFLAGLFTRDAEIRELVVKILRIYCIMMPLLWQFSAVVPAHLRAAGDTNYTTAVAVFSMAVMRIGFGYVLALVLHWGVMGIWFSMFADWFLRGICYTVRYLRGKWMDIKLF